MTAVLFLWHALKLSWQQHISDHKSDAPLPTHWRTISLNSAKVLLISHYKWNIWSLYCENPSIACLSSSGHLGVKWLIFACFADILSLPERVATWFLLQCCNTDSLCPWSWVISELFSTASASVINFILKAIVYKEQCAFGMMRKITEMKEILDWNVCQVTVTESIVVFLQSCSSINIFTDLLFFLLGLFSSISFCVHWAISQFFARGSLPQMAHYNQEL